MSFKNQYFLDKTDAEVAKNFRQLFTRTILLIIVFLSFLFIINHNQKRALVAVQLLDHTKEVIFQSEKTISLVKDYETNARGFTITGKEEFLNNASFTRDTIKNAVERLQLLTIDNPSQQITVDSFAKFIEKRISISDYSIHLRRDSGLIPAMQFVSNGTGKKCMDTIRMLEKNIQLKENNLLGIRDAANKMTLLINRITLTVSLVIFFIILLILFWQAWFNLKKYHERQKEVNAILRQLAQSLINAQKIAHVGSWEWNLVTNEEKWSDEQCRIFGYEPGNIEITHSLFLNSIHPFDRMITETAIAQAIEKRAPYNIRFRIARPNGEIRFINALGEIYLNKEMPEILAGTIQDITEQVMKEKENAKLENLMQKINEVAAIGWWENELVAGKIKWSAVTMNILEVSTDFEPGSNSILFFIKEEKSRQLAENVFSAAIINGVSFDINLPFETAKGKSIKARFTGYPDFENGQCIRIYGFIQPINE